MTAKDGVFSGYCFRHREPTPVLAGYSSWSLIALQQCAVDCAVEGGIRRKIRRRASPRRYGKRKKGQKKGRDDKPSPPIEKVSHGRGRRFKPCSAHHDNQGVSQYRLTPFLFLLCGSVIKLAGASYEKLYQSFDRGTLLHKVSEVINHLLFLSVNLTMGLTGFFAVNNKIIKSLFQVTALMSDCLRGRKQLGHFVFCRPLENPLHRDVVKI
jgi:hypothetical protein